MAEPGRGLQVDEDVGFQHREWRVQHAGRLAVGLLLLAALFGVFSNGPLSSSTATSGGVRLEYQRFVRSGGNVEMSVRVPGAMAANQRISLWLPNTYLDATEVRSVQPQPDVVEVRGGGAAYIFAVPEPRGVLHAVFHTRPQREGFRRSRLTVNSAPTIRFWQLSYP